MFGETGFDIVIGNPPYRQLQKDGGALSKKYKDAGFRSFTGQGDIYQLFIEKGLNLLLGRQSVLGYITSNSWQKARYGTKTRELLDEHSPLEFINLGPGVFQNAVVDTCVLIVRHGHNGETCRTLELRQGDPFPPLETADWADLRQIRGGPWCVLSRPEWCLMEKIEAAGTPLGEWPGISIHRGLVTGLNKAFIINNDTKEALVREDPRSAELLKPVVRGRDVHAYRACWAGKWLIATFPAARIDIHDYPAIRRHLLQFGKRLQQTGETLPDGLRTRKKTPHAWWELQDSCSYHEEFRKPKLVWREISAEPRFAYSADGTYCNNKVYLLTCNVTTDLAYLCAVLNSQLMAWYGRHVLATTGQGDSSWFKYSVASLPLPMASDRNRREIGKSVLSHQGTKSPDDGISLAAERAVLDAHTTNTQQEIASLYRITKKEEVLILESSRKAQRSS